MSEGGILKPTVVIRSKSITQLARNQSNYDLIQKPKLDIDAISGIVDFRNASCTM